MHKKSTYFLILFFMSSFIFAINGALDYKFSEEVEKKWKKINKEISGFPVFPVIPIPKDTEDPILKAYEEEQERLFLRLRRAKKEEETSIALRRVRYNTYFYLKSKEKK